MVQRSHTRDAPTQQIYCWFFGHMSGFQKFRLFKFHGLKMPPPHTHTAFQHNYLGLPKKCSHKTIIINFIFWTRAIPPAPKCCAIAQPRNQTIYSELIFKNSVFIKIIYAAYRQINFYDTPDKCKNTNSQITKIFFVF